MLTFYSAEVFYPDKKAKKTVTQAVSREKIKARILIVDDEPINIEIMSELFGLHGAETISASDGATALELARREMPDLVLLDVMMPGMNGYEVCRRLKADEVTRRLPVVMVTGLGQIDDKIKGLEAGADDFLSKPVHMAELVTRTRSLLRVKELNDDLEGAYRSLAGIASFTNNLLRDFDPYHFDLTRGLDDLMAFLLGSAAGAKMRPQRVLLFNAVDSNGWEGWVYKLEKGKVLRRALQNGVDEAMLKPLFGGSGRKASGQVYVNLDEGQRLTLAEAPLWRIIGQLPPWRNVVAFRSPGVAVAALDVQKAVGPYDAQVLSAMVANIHFFLRTISSQVQEVERAFLYTIGALARAAETHDEDTGDHIMRVNGYAEALAQALGCEDEFCRVLAYSAQMHDVGKLHVHPDILRKPAGLDAREWEAVKLHTVYGARILGDDPRLAMAKEIALSHHEKWDGSGYPNGLAGEGIPLSGRITMMADVYDALRSARPYKRPFDHQTSVDIIRHGDERLRPGHFDPRVLEAFLDNHRLFDEIFARY